MANTRKRHGSFIDFVAGVFGSKNLQAETRHVPVVEAWKNLDDRMDPFEKLREAKELVLDGKLSTSTYDALYRLATERATGKETYAQSQARKGLKPSQMQAAHTVFDKSIAEGHLEFRDPKGRWKNSYVILTPSKILVFVNKSEARQRKHHRVSLALSADYYVTDSEMRSNSHIFMVSDMDKRLYLAAEDEEARQLWMATISRVVRRLQTAASYFDEPVLLGRPSRTASMVQSDYDERLRNYHISLQRERAAELSEKKMFRDSVALAQENAPVRKKSVMETLTGKTVESVEEVRERRRRVRSKRFQHAVERQASMHEMDVADGTLKESAQMATSDSPIKERRGTPPKLTREASKIELEALRSSALAMEEHEHEEFSMRQEATALAMADLDNNMQSMEDDPEIAAAKARKIAEEEEAKSEKQEKDAFAEAERLMALAAEKRKQAAAAMEKLNKKREAAAASAASTTASTTPPPEVKKLDDEALALDVGGRDELLKAASAATERDLARAKADAVQRLLKESRRVLERSRMQVERKLGKTVFKEAFDSAPVKVNAGKQSALAVSLQAKIDALVALITKEGAKAEDGSFGLSFEEISEEWKDVKGQSVEELTGLLLRAKRARLLTYEGDSLYKNAHETVMVWTMKESRSEML